MLTAISIWLFVLSVKTWLYTKQQYDLYISLMFLFFSQQYDLFFTLITLFLVFLLFHVKY